MTAASVLVHELGHALVARRLGVPTASIELHFFGGAAQITGMPKRPRDEIAIAAAGPAVSFALAGLGHGLAAVTGLPLLSLLGWVNLALGAFNLLPVFPSDGGRILRAWLARRRGLVGATELALKVARVACIALGVAGLAWGSFQLVLVALALWVMGGAERRVARERGDSGHWRGDAPAARVITDAEYFAPDGTRPWPPAERPGAPRPFGSRRWTVVWHD